MRTEGQVILKLQEITEKLEKGDLGRTLENRAVGYQEALSWVLSGGGQSDADRPTVEDLLLAIYNELQEWNSKQPGLPTGPETR